MLVRNLLILVCSFVAHSDCQFWGSLGVRSGGFSPPPTPDACPVDGSASFKCVPAFRCPHSQARFSKFYCDWNGRMPLVCCEKQPAEQGCGLVHGASSRPRDHILSAIVGGISLRQASTSPWMAAVGERLPDGAVNWYCGGTLINPNTVLTAAHCVIRKKPNMVRVGDLDLSRSNEPNAAPEDVHVAATTVHPEYKLPAYYHDVALLHLARPVRTNKFVKPICLATDSTQTFATKQATLTGWGHLEFGGDKSNVLQEVGVTVWNNADCTKAYAPPKVPAKNYPRGIVDSQMCAGDPKGGKDACQGDSGGPLVVKVGNTHTLVGIVSSGIGCGAKSFPGVYSRVSSYADWINEQSKKYSGYRPRPGYGPGPGSGGPNRYNGNGGNGNRYNPYQCSQFNPC